jgi:formate dehydrogenase iron-sulfur subunit
MAQQSATPAATTAAPPSATPAAGTPVPLASIPPASAYAPPGAFPPEPLGFYTDTTVCIGCKACEVACKNWNGLSATNGGANTLSGDSYDNTRQLDGQHWRHVKFIEQFDEDRTNGRWLMMSDVCKHCVQAGCLEVCPTGAIMRTEYDTVVIQADVCNGCRDCIGACPFGVIEINPVNNTAMKCTLCYDRLHMGMAPACAQACPTASIQFGPIADLKQRAQQRVELLNSQAKAAGKPEQYTLYGADDSFLGGLNSFYLLADEPEVYGLPNHPTLPSQHLAPNVGLSVAGAVGVGLLGLLGLRKRRMDELAAEARAGQAGGAAEPGMTTDGGEEAPHA